MLTADKFDRVLVLGAIYPSDFSFVRVANIQQSDKDKPNDLA
jgi:hypothetical protein